MILAAVKYESRSRCLAEPHKGRSLRYIVDMGNGKASRRSIHRVAASIPVFLLVCLPGEIRPQLTTELTKIEQIRSLKPNEAQRAIPVRLRGAVSVLSGYKNSFFLLDGHAAISIDRTTEFPVLHAGEQVEVRGVTNPGRFAPTVVAHSVTVLGQSKLPEPPLYSMDQLAGGRQDSQWIAVRGIVRSAAVQPHWGRLVLTLEVDIGAGNLITVHVLDYSKPGWERLPGASVTVRGACGTVFNDRRQFVGIRMFSSSLDDVKVETPAPLDPFNTPRVALDQLLQFGERVGALQRVRVAGRVTYSQPGLGLYIQSGQQGLFVRGDQNGLVPQGTLLDAVGFPTPGRNSPILDDALYRIAGAPSPVSPTPAVASAMIVVNQFGFSAAPFDSTLVKLQGRVVEDVHYPKEDQLLLRDGDTFFAARLSQAQKSRLALAVGTLVSVTGICVAEIDEAHEAESFQLLLRTPADIVVLQNPPWWNARHAGWVVACASVVCFVAFGIFSIFKRNAELRALAMTDPLTGLNNRRGFFMVADHQWKNTLRRNATWLLFYLDIDRFKEINDTLGHKEGDQMLQQVAEILRGCFRSADIIARIGGDEFVVACEAPPASEIILESRLKAAVEACNQKEERKAQLSLSVGVLACDASLQAHTVGELLTKADELMYRQKRERREEKP